jgi:hypothetical protein
MWGVAISGTVKVGRRGGISASCRGLIVGGGNRWKRSGLRLSWASRWICGERRPGAVASYENGTKAMVREGLPLATRKGHKLRDGEWLSDVIVSCSCGEGRYCGEPQGALRK